MVTKVISLKDYRSQITKLWKEANEKNIRYIVLFHSKPILEVLPYSEDELVFEDSNDNQKDYYESLNQSMSFWNNPKDDNIFEI